MIWKEEGYFYPLPLLFLEKDVQLRVSVEACNDSLSLIGARDEK